MVRATELIHRILERQIEEVAREANAILFAFDNHYDTDSNGKVHTVKYSGMKLKQLQDLRDRLFANHQHPEHME
jgi:hypothetical protein